MMKNRFLYYIGVVAAGAIFLVINPEMFSSSTEEITVWCSQEPNSADPYDFDLHAHHVVFGPVFSKLFTAYKEGVITPVLVSDWKVSNSFKEWVFNFRDDVTFADGTVITAEHVAKNLKRILILAKKNGSALKLLELVDGARGISRVEDELKGIVVNNRRLTVRLVEPEQNLHELLAFGLYGIAHPANFSSDGSWKGNELIASGPYRIDILKKDVVLHLREEYPIDLRHPEAFKKISINWDFNRRLTADLADGFSGEPSPGQKYKFRGQTSAEVFFMHVFSWLDPKSVFAKRENRIWLREKFYSELSDLNVKPIRSFFPPILPGVHELPPVFWKEENSPLRGVKVNIRPPKNTQVPALRAVKEAIISAIKEAGADLTVIDDITTTKFVSLTHAKRGVSIEIDLYPRITSIGNEDPRETAKFMFTKEGIYLPDPDGKAAKLMRSKNFSIQELNKIIFDQAIIWPIINDSLGFWANEKIDLSLYNHQWPLSELHWMGAAH